MKNFFCEKHSSRDGFIDPEGNWNCWLCYKEDYYLNPAGEIISKITIKGKYEIRMLATGAHEIIIEEWLIKGRRAFLDSSTFPYLSQAISHYEWLIKKYERR